MKCDTNEIAEKIFWLNINLGNKRTNLEQI